MLPNKIAFVDIETTGTSLQKDRIIEVAVLRVENNKLVDTFQSLVNPETYIPLEIERLTGIGSRELERAPIFHHIHKDLLSVLKGCVFCAHNVRFDYGFIKNELKREGVSFTAKNLCTVKLSRKIYPEYPNHSLDHLIERLDFKCDRRHRAYDDAKVIWDFYQLLLKNVSLNDLGNAVNYVLKKPSTPINVSQKILDRLPESPGVYIFYSQNGMPLYVGKSINIKNRVLSHFSGDHQNSKELKISQQVYSIETKTTAGELGALLREAKMVKELQPLYNRKLRYCQKVTFIKSQKNDRGYETVYLKECENVEPRELEHIIGVFKSKKQARDYLIAQAFEHQLCETLLGLQNGKTECFGYQLGKCRGACIGNESPERYNARFILAFFKNRLHPWPFPGPIEIKEENKASGNAEIHIINNWCYLGSKLFSDDLPDEQLSKDIKFDLDTYKILVRYLKKTNLTFCIL